MKAVDRNQMNNCNSKLAYYITPHGFGHAIRSLEVIRHLMMFDPTLEVTIISDLPQFLIEQNLHKPVRVRKKRLDIGLVQRDSLQFDLEATLVSLESLYERRDEMMEEETEFLMQNEIRMVVSDIPSAPFYASSACGIPGVGLGNFTWDWIYTAYGASDRRWRPLVEWIKEGYRHCDLFLQLPMHGDCSVFPTIQDVPLIARKSQRDPRKTREILGCDPQQKAYLISFFALELDEDALRRIERIDCATFFYKHPIHYRLKNGRSLDGLDLSYADAVAAMDGVITKPGYGIVADCLAHGTPIIYSDRGFFPEYEILVRELERGLNAIYLPSEDLYAGRWESAIRRLGKKPDQRPAIRVDGAGVCAQIILSELAAHGATGDGEVVVMPIEDSLDLHTFQPKEVKDLLQDYLEAAHLKGFSEVRIIHGKGRGILREKVHSILKRHPLVASFRESDPASGGWGSTRVVLKPLSRK
jgi:hypothetical protein